MTSNFPHPSEIMRIKRPYLYSDSSLADAYKLGRSEFSHFLDTLTQRNQHKDFEIFVRHLCERVLCPNLRTQTGPEGGGDGKVDTETYPVAGEISDRWYVGDANSGQERWAFAMSAKEEWAPKVRSDVKGIYDTGREYNRIFFLTSRAVKAKRCHDIEKELEDKYGIPVTILDREWIIEKTIENGYADLAFTDLGAGAHDPAKLIIGPSDYERQQNLDVLEERLSKLGQHPSEITQAISDAYNAARFSREVERPRIETEGRFLRAIKLAGKHGTDRQLLRAKYESAWTMLWWFDDIEAINETYEEIEEIAFASNDATNLSKVCNLQSVLVGRVLQGWENKTYLNVDERTDRLKAKLAELSIETSRPNNALHSETLLALMGLSNINAEAREDALDDVWIKLSDLIDKSYGLGEYPADLVDEVVQAISSLAPESQPLDQLVEKLAGFMGNRQQEGKAGSIFLLRGNQKLQSERPMDAVAWLGKASICFMKEEYREEQFESLYSLAIAYRGAGLLWAARAVCLSALVQVTSLSSNEGEIRLETIPTISLFALISMQLGRVPDLLLSALWLRSFQTSLPLSEGSQTHLEEKLLELDGLLSCLLAGLENASLPHLVKMPDILESLGFFSSKIVLMYRLGRGEELRIEGLMPENTSISELKKMVDTAASQPACESFPKNVRNYSEDNFDAITTVLGVAIRFCGGTSLEDHLLCEAHLTAIESFFATSFTNGMWPKAESLSIKVERQADLEEISIDFDPVEMNLLIAWPSSVSVQNVEAVRDLGAHLVEFCAYTLGAIAIVPECEVSFEKMVSEERLFERTVSFSFSHFANSRIMGGNASSFSDLDHLVKKTYNIKDPIPKIVAFELPKLDNVEIDVEPVERPVRHDGYTVKSVINTHLWDNAGWKGLVFAHSGSDDPYPPVIGIIFSDREMAEAIFRGWIDRVGRADKEGLIRIALLRGVDRDNKHHYRAHISQNLSKDDTSIGSKKMFVKLSRVHTMLPNDSANLNGFLDQYESFQAYYLIPAVLTNEGPPELLTDMSILKRNLQIRDAWQIARHDEDMAAMRKNDKVCVPEGVEYVPFFNAQKFFTREID